MPYIDEGDGEYYQPSYHYGGGSVGTYNPEEEYTTADIEAVNRYNRKYKTRAGIAIGVPLTITIGIVATMIIFTVMASNQNKNITAGIIGIVIPITAYMGIAITLFSVLYALSANAADRAQLTDTQQEILDSRITRANRWSDRNAYVRKRAPFDAGVSALHDHFVTHTGASPFEYR